MTHAPAASSSGPGSREEAFGRKDDFNLAMSHGSLSGSAVGPDATPARLLRSAQGVSPRRVFVTHGEPPAADAFLRRLRDSFGWNTVDPDDGWSWALG